MLGFLLPEQRSYKMSDGTDFNLRAGAHTYPYFFFDRKTGMPASSFKRGMLRVEEYGQAQPDVKRAFARLSRTATSAGWATIFWARAVRASTSLS